MSGTPVDGFELDRDEFGYQAKCRACGDAMVRLEGEARGAFIKSVLVVICLPCFAQAAAVNGVIVETD